MRGYSQRSGEEITVIYTRKYREYRNKENKENKEYKENKEKRLCI